MGLIIDYNIKSGTSDKLHIPHLPSIFLFITLTVDFITEEIPPIVFFNFYGYRIYVFKPAKDNLDF